MRIGVRTETLSTEKIASVSVSIDFCFGCIFGGRDRSRPYRNPLNMGVSCRDGIHAIRDYTTHSEFQPTLIHYQKIVTVCQSKYVLLVGVWRAKPDCVLIINRLFHKLYV